jgi:PhnB protein
MSRENSHTDNEAEIRALLDSRAAAFRAGDARAFVAGYAAEVVTFDLPPPLRTRGVDAKGVAVWMATFAGPLGHDVRELTITASSDVAFVHSLVHLTGERPGENVDLWFRETLGLRRIHGRWAITHEHSSVPLLMDGSDRAAVNLQP